MKIKVVPIIIGALGGVQSKLELKLEMIIRDIDMKIVGGVSGDLRRLLVI